MMKKRGRGLLLQETVRIRTVQARAEYSGGAGFILLDDAAALLFSEGRCFDQVGVKL